MKNVSVLIMAGGKSERMCSPKPFLLIDGNTFMERIAKAYLRFGVKNIFIVLNHELVKKIPTDMDWVHIVSNAYPEYGRFYSLQTGLRQLPKDNFVFIHNVDNPFVEQYILEKIWSKRNANGFALPVYKGRGGHPVLICSKIARHILSVSDDSLDLRAILRQYKRIEVESDSEKVLTNINTWPEYEEKILSLIPEYCCD